MVQHPIGDAAEQEATHLRATVRADHDQVGLLIGGVAHDLLRRRSGEDGGGEQARLDRMPLDQTRQSLLRGGGPLSQQDGQIESGLSTAYMEWNGSATTWITWSRAWFRCAMSRATSRASADMGLKSTATTMV